MILRAKQTHMKHDALPTSPANHPTWRKIKVRYETDIYAVRQDYTPPSCDGAVGSAFPDGGFIMRKAAASKPQFRPTTTVSSF